MKKVLRILSFSGVAGLLVGLFLPALVSAGAYPGTNGKIAYSSPDGVKVVKADGTSSVTIPDTDSMSGQPRLSPDGTRVVWTQYNGFENDDYANVKVAKADGTGVATDITTGTTARNDGSTWSPDGKWLIFAQDTTLNAEVGGAIMIVDSDGGTITELINAEPCTGGSADTEGWEEPSWSANGSRIALINRCDDADGGVYVFSVLGYTADSDTKPTADLPNATHISADNDGTLTDYWPSFSPDNSKIVFTRVNGANVSIQSASDTELGSITQLYDAGMDYITVSAFSPDGTKIVFDQDTSGTKQLKTIAAAGGAATAIPNTTGANSADWGVAVEAASGGGTTVIDDDQSSTDFTVDDNETLEVNGQAGDVTISSGGTLTGSGSTGNVIVESGGTLHGTGTAETISVESGGHVAPGNSPGCINSGNLSFTSGSFLDIELAGTTVCSEYDSVNVTGTVDLGNATLNTALLSGFVPAVGNTFTIVDNDAADTVTGTFTGLAEGASFTDDGVTYEVSYTGGDGNDVVLTVTAVADDAGSDNSSTPTPAAPGTPNTGIKAILASPLAGIMVIAMAAGVAYIARKQFLNQRLGASR